MKPTAHGNFEDDDPIEALAMSWLVERDEGFAPGRAAEFARWCSASPLHKAAVERLEQTWGLLLELPRLPTNQAKCATAHRRALATPTWIALAAAAVLMVGIVSWRNAVRSPKADYATVAGALQRIELRDGSVITLNASSAVRVDYSSGIRRVTLASGEAYFEVAHDVRRPFVVTADSVDVRAVGTAFSVRVGTKAIEVVVSAGKVRLTEPVAITGPTPTELARLPLLEQGDRAILSRGPDARRTEFTKLDTTQLGAALAWRKEMLVFKETPLHEVIAQFNRSNQLQLRLGDAELGERLIGGTFATRNVEAFVALLERGGDLSLDRIGDREIILRRAH